MLVLQFQLLYMLRTIELLQPQKDLPFPLMKALDKRETKRKWENKLLTLQEISDLCWVACGETKPATKRTKNKRTVPSGCNSQIISLYVALDSGVYKYLEPDHCLEQITDSDVRSTLSTQKMMKSAPFGLIYVADFSKTIGITKANHYQKMFAAGTEAGLMGQNIYLYCAAANLNTVLIALVNREKLHKNMKLKESESVIYTQIIGKSPEVE